MSIHHPHISWNRYPENRGSIRKLGNGNDEYKYIYSAREDRKCTVYYEVDVASERIIAVRFEGTPDTCYRIP